MEFDGKTISNVVIAKSGRNANGILYTREAMEKAVERLKDREQPIFGTLGQDVSEPFSFPYNKISHVVRNLRMEGDDVVADVDVLTTPLGNALRDLITGGHANSFHFGPKAVGKLDDDKAVYDMTFASFDVVPNDYSQKENDEDRTRNQERDQET